MSVRYGAVSARRGWAGVAIQRLPEIALRPLHLTLQERPDRWRESHDLFEPVAGKDLSLGLDLVTGLVERHGNEQRVEPFQLLVCERPDNLEDRSPIA